MYWDSMNDSYETMQSTRMNKNETSHFEMDDSIDKENVGFGSPSGKFDADLSLYETNSPTRMSCDGSPAERQIRQPLDADNFDPNSQDSGYSAFDFNKGISPKGRGLSFGSMISMEDEFLDISELEQDTENVRLPGDFNKLITGSLVSKQMIKTPEMFLARPPLRRALSMIANSNTPNSNTPNSTSARSCLFKPVEENEIRSFKRPEPPSDLQSPLNKRCKLFTPEDNQIIKRIPARPLLQRSVSATEDSIKSALQRSSNEPDLIGDFSKPFCLPLTPGRHQDLKSITSATLAQLMQGEFTDLVASFKLIDCRYPYEFDGGHITGAQNLYTKQQVLDELLSISKNLQPNSSDLNKRHIVVFHCEFSSERAPNLSRYLRNIDRSHNKDFYPFLHYPEVYLLDGGYKQFYETHINLCSPNSYVPMNHPGHEENLKHFRSKSKTWNSDTRSKTNLRSSSFKRL